MSDNAGEWATMGIVANLSDFEKRVLPFWWFCGIMPTKKVPCDVAASRAMARTDGDGLTGLV